MPAFGRVTTKHLAGSGILRWSESTPQGNRIGIEVLQLDGESREQFARWLKMNDPVSFIPKDRQSQFVGLP